jgi:chromatin modification-related protein VID21
MLTLHSSIVVSRKRKLRELFNVAATDDLGIPNRDVTKTDATNLTPTEIKLLHASDILQYVWCTRLSPILIASSRLHRVHGHLQTGDGFRGRKVRDLNIPPRRPLAPNGLELFLGTSDNFELENVAPNVPGEAIAKGVPVENFTTPSSQGTNTLKGTETSSEKRVDPRSASQQLPITREPNVDASRVDLSVDQTKPGQDALVPHLQSTGVARRNPDGQKLANGTSIPTTLEKQERAKNGPLPVISAVPQLSVATSATTGVKTGIAAPSKSTDSAQTLQADPDAMDIDDLPGPRKARFGESHPQSGLIDSARYGEAASSPGSTAHSATTPAVHDVSTDTSPDTGGPQYEEKDDEEETSPKTPTPEDVVRRTHADVIESGLPNEISTGQASAAADGVEAQLLQESAAAQLAQLPTGVVSEVHGERTAGASTVNSGEPRIVSEAECKPNALTNASGAKSLSDGVLAQDSVVTPLIQPTETAEKHGDPSNATTIDITMREVPDSQESESLDPMQVDKPSIDETGHTVPTSTTVDRSLGIEPVGKVPSTITPASDSPAALNSPTTDRLGTQITTGNVRQKAVSEILASTPAPLPTPSEPAHPASDDELSAPPPYFKAGAMKARDRRKKSVPTVVFGKPPKPPRKPEENTIVASGQKPGQIPSDDYFTPLFIEGFTKQTTWMKPLEKLLNTAHKTVSTPDQYLSLSDHQACKILRRVYHLQQHNKWSLRQPMRCPEPTRSLTHWDLLLREMKWMRTDFREERKWKLAVAKNLAYDCAEWVWSSPEERKALQVKVVRRSRKSTASDTMEGLGDAVPDLDHVDSPAERDDEAVSTPMATVAPSAIFGLQDDEVVFGLHRSQAADQLLEELPLYGVPLSVPKMDSTGPEFDPDAHWKRPALPLSKYIEGEMVIDTKPPPQKRSRFQYSLEDETDDEGQVVFGSPPLEGAVLPPVNSNVALFDPDMKAIRDRLHAGHQFRPPTDQYMPMPHQGFYESRVASQWTMAEDDELKALVQDYSYNWFLISSMISSKSLFPPAAERRTPWECFERWINLEGLPHDMSKTPYFKIYQNRIDAAQRAIAQHNQVMQQQAQANRSATPLPRKRPTLTTRVERRRNQKHLALIDSFRKLAKKRESAAQKAQHALSLAAMRKANETPRPPGPSKTPHEYSLMRFERDQQLAERMAQYAQRQQEASAKRVSRYSNRRMSLASERHVLTNLVTRPPSLHSKHNKPGRLTQPRLQTHQMCHNSSVKTQRRLPQLMPWLTRPELRQQTLQIPQPLPGRLVSPPHVFQCRRLSTAWSLLRGSCLAVVWLPLWPSLSKRNCTPPYRLTKCKPSFPKLRRMPMSNNGWRRWRILNLIYSSSCKPVGFRTSNGPLCSYNSSNTSNKLYNNISSSNTRSINKHTSSNSNSSSSSSNPKLDNSRSISSRSHRSPTPSRALRRECARLSTGSTSRTSCPTHRLCWLPLTQPTRQTWPLLASLLDRQERLAYSLRTYRQSKPKSRSWRHNTGPKIRISRKRR